MFFISLLLIASQAISLNLKSKTASNSALKLKAITESDIVKGLQESVCHKVQTIGGDSHSKEYVDKLFKKSREADKEYARIIRKVNKKLRKTTATCFKGPLKTRERVDEKVTNDYDGDYSRITDIVRASCKAKKLKDLIKAKRLIKKAFKGFVYVKDRFAKPTGSGYRDMLTIVQAKNGILGEFQFHFSQILDAKDCGHAFYEVQRTLENYEDEGMTKEELDEFKDNITEIEAGLKEEESCVDYFDEFESIRDKILTPESLTKDAVTEIVDECEDASKVLYRKAFNKVLKQG